MGIILLSEGLRFLKRRIKVAFAGIEKYDGNAEHICLRIVKSCFNQRFFQVSTQNYSQFYARDFGWCVDSLNTLGFEKEIRSTLGYALNAYEKHGLTSVAISPSGKPFNFPDNYAPDTLAFLIRSLRVADAQDLIKKHKIFLTKEIAKFYETVIDKDTGLVKKDTHFSSMKDYAIRHSSCYDNIMAAMLSRELDILHLPNPMKHIDFKRLIKKHFWTGNYFLDDLSGSKHIAADANIFPFWSGIFTDKAMLRSALTSIQSANLDKPFPVRYTSSRIKSQKMLPFEFLVRDWETHSVWTHMGLLYIRILKDVDKEKAAFHISQYTKIIEHNRNFLEVFNRDGKPFSSPFYYSDSSMLWAANYLTLNRLPPGS